MKYFQIRVWPRGGHWYFDVTIEAADERDAWKVAHQEYPRREYSIHEVREVFR